MPVPCNDIQEIGFGSLYYTDSTSRRNYVWRCRDMIRCMEFQDVRMACMRREVIVMFPSSFVPGNKVVHLADLVTSCPHLPELLIRPPLRIKQRNWTTTNSLPTEPHQNPIFIYVWYR